MCRKCLGCNRCSDSEDLRVKRRKLGSDLMTQEQPLAMVRRERDSLLTQIQHDVFQELHEEFRSLSSSRKEQDRKMTKMSQAVSEAQKKVKKSKQVEMAHKLTIAEWLQVLSEEEEIPPL